MADFASRFARIRDELKWLYFELYAELPMEERTRCFALLTESLRAFAAQRREPLKQLDLAREAQPDWYQSRQLLGMCLYVKEFAGSLRGVQEKLPYLESLGVNYLHLMPLLDTVDGESDGGYAVSDFRRVKPELGTMEDLEALIADCHARGMSCCMDFVMNHSGSSHEWARRAKAGEREYQDYYFFYDSWEIPNEFEKTVPQVFPTTAPGSFTWVPECGKVVMTSFYPYQWDLNYRNPAVFQAMMENLLYLANRGIDVIRIDAVPYIWKQLGTDCRNLKQVHSIVRMCRLICEAVCPSVILLGEVVMAPEKLAPYFGPTEKPECHMLYNATTMCTLWHTVATHDARLLRHQLDVLATLPRSYVFLNYVRCHDDIGWGLDFRYLAGFGMQEVPHKAFLNAWFAGEYPGSPSRGERYNDDPRLGDARMCGTTASLTGVGTAQDADAMDKALRLDLMLHAFILTQSGLPILYAGDEVAQLNDDAYRLDPLRAEDSRNLHRGVFDWQRAENRFNPDTPQGRLFQGLRRLVQARRENPAFAVSAACHTIDLPSPSLLGLVREAEGQTLCALFNFGDGPAGIHLPWAENTIDLLSGERPSDVLPAGGFVWMTERTH